MSGTHNDAQTKLERAVDEVWVYAVLFNEGVDSIEVPFQGTEFDLESQSEERSLMMVIKERVCSLRSRRQKPDDVLLDYSDQS
jgi:hypothetical protein